MRMLYRFKKINIKNTKFKIFLSMILPFLLAMTILMIASSYNFKRNKELALDSCLSSMQLFSQRCENEIMNVVHSAIFLSENTNFNNALNNVADLSDSQTLFNIKNAILNFEEVNSVVRNVMIINQNNGYVITSDGLYTFDDYFEKVFFYKNYGKDYWKEYRSFVPSQYTILSPCSFTAGEETGAVIPIVVFENYDERFRNLLIVNVSIDSLIELQRNNISNQDTKIVLMNNYSGDIFYRIGNLTYSENILNSELYRSLLNQKFFKQDFLSYGKSFFAAYSTKNNLTGYTYFGVIPYGSINGINFGEILISILIFLLFVVLMIFYSMKNANKIVVPVQKTIEMISSQSISAEDIFEKLEIAAINISETNANLYTTLPYAQEKYLISFLNSADYSITEAAKSILKNTLPFKYNYFSSVILHIYPTKLFFEIYDQLEYANIQSGLCLLVKQLFEEKYSVFFLTSEKDVLYIIVNTENDECMEDIKNMTSEINDLLKYDLGYLNVYLGFGGSYKGWSGLKQGYREAMSNLKRMQCDSSKDVINRDEYLNDAKLSQFYNVLVSSNVEDAKKLIDKYCNDAMDDQRWLKQLYTQILTTIFKVLRTKNISYNDNQLDFELYSNILVKSCSEIYKEIVMLLNTIKESNESDISIDLGEEIIDYINNNYTEATLSLGMLADIFEVQPTYVSTLVKNTIGVGFHKHLLMLRISKAKELLTSTNMSIQEIYENCGFCSKPTFFRTFRQYTGMTPTEYRKNQNQKA